MNTVVIDEYMEALLGGPSAVEPARVQAGASPAAAAAPAAATSPHPAVAVGPRPARRRRKPAAPVAPAAAPTTPVTTPTPAIVAAPLDPDMITDDEFEHLLDDLHGGAAPGANGLTTATPAAAPAPAPAVIAAAPVPPDMISDDEFEHLLDSLHGAAAPGANGLTTATPAAAPAPAPAAIAAVPVPADMITDDEFEHLLDSLHGAAAPGANGLSRAEPAAPPRAAAPAPAPAPMPAAAPPRTDTRKPATSPQPWHPSLATTPEARPHTPVEQSSRWLHLRCSGQHYAVELLKVQEVMVPVPLLPMRGTGPGMLGVMNLRGLVVPVVDLGVRLGLSAITIDTGARIVVLEQQGDTLGLLVSAVDDVITLRQGQIEPPEHARIGRSADAMFRGVTRQRNASSPVILLDACALLERPTG